METLTFTDTHVMVPSNKPYEQVIRALESVLGEGNVRSFTEMVGVTGTWDEFVRETEQYIGKCGLRDRPDRPRRVDIPGTLRYEGKALRDRQPPHRQADA